MPVFCDTSGLYAAIDASDEQHQSARALWPNLVQSEDRLVTTNYVLLETLALLQARLGMRAASEFCEVVCPILEVGWVDAALHDAALGEFLLARKRRLSLVDCTSFLYMRRNGLRTAFAYDRHFSEYGFASPQ